MACRSAMVSDLDDQIVALRVRGVCEHEICVLQ